MESGKLCAALLSKSYTVALLYISTAAAKKMKEAEVAVVERVRAWWGEENRKGVGRIPIGLGKDNNVLCPVLGLSC